MIRSFENRKQDIDIMRGLLIVLVVIGHHSNDEIAGVIYWFHMPAFFILSGILLQDRQEPIQSFMARKAKRLLIPYILYSFVLILIIDGDIKSFLEIVFGGSSRFVYGVYWYIPVLLTSEVVCHWLVNIKKLSQKALFVVALLGVIASSVYSYAFYSNLDTDCTKWDLWHKIPWGVDISVLGVSYVLLGYLMRRYYEQISKWYVVLLSTMVVILSITLKCYGIFDYTFDMKQVKYPNALYNLILPIAWTIFIWTMAKLILNLKVLCNVLSYVGRESLVIMYLHSRMVFLVKAFFPQLWGTVYVITSILLSLLVGLIVRKIVQGTKYIVTRMNEI